MKICYIADINSIHTQRIVKHFACNGHEVDVLSLNKPEYFLVGNNIDFKVHYIGPFRTGKKFSFRFFSDQIKIIKKVKKIIKKINPDILHALFITDHGFFGALSGFHPFVVFAMGSDMFVNPYKNKLYKIAYKFVLRHADVLHCETLYAKKKLCCDGVSSNKLLAFPFGIDLNFFRFKKKDQHLLELLNLSINHKIIISTRNLEKIYSVNTLIKAIPKVINSFPEARFIIVGKGSLEDNLKELAYKSKINQYIRFVGFIQNSEIPNYLNLADIFISTSLSDTFSISALEAMACNKPIIVTNIPGTDEWVEDHKNGLLFEKQNHSDLSEKIKFLLGNYKLAKEMGEKNRKIVEQRADVVNYMIDIAKIYSKLLG